MSGRRPTQRGLARTLSYLQASDQPIDSTRLVDHFDLLAIPLFDGIESPDDRAQPLVRALPLFVREMRLAERTIARALLLHRGPRPWPRDATLPWMLYR